MTERAPFAEAVWESGEGTVRLGSGAFEGAYAMGDVAGGTNPTELLAAAHATCFALTLAAGLRQMGHTPTRIHASSTPEIVWQEGAPRIGSLALRVEVEAPGLEEEQFRQVVASTEANCPVSQALSATEMVVSARLI